jgi:exosortase
LQTPRFMELTRTSIAGWWLLVAALLFTALLSIWPLSQHWSADPQYHFGFLVPLLAGVLSIRRWRTRPPPGPPSGFAKLAIIIAGALFLPLWIFLQPNPDWRLLNWLATTVCGILLVAIAAMHGGQAWLRHFAFPSFFLLTAVPWPTGMEWSITQALMRWVATATAEILSLCGVPAVAQGNLLEVAAGTLGVELACSGIRSLQPALMMALFLGELFRFATGRRFALFVLAIVTALVTTIGRVLVLAVVANAQGLGAIDRWHDPAGTVLVTVCFVLLWGVAMLLGRGFRNPRATVATAPTMAVGFGWPLFLGAWMAVSIVATALWFRGGETPQPTPWAFSPPAQAAAESIDADALAMLKFDQGAGWRWHDTDGLQWIGFHFRWYPGPARSRMLLSMHRPDICLPAVGLRLQEDRGTVNARVSNGLEIPFHAYRFATASGPLFVYYTLYRNGAPILAGGESVRRACFRAVADRQKSLDQEVLQLAVLGCDTADAADAALRKISSTLLREAPAAR